MKDVFCFKKVFICYVLIQHYSDAGMSKAFIGKAAPEFEATAVVDGTFKKVKLSDYKGKYLVLFFYPMDL